jgi:hypothetical protein
MESLPSREIDMARAARLGKVRTSPDLSIVARLRQMDAPPRVRIGGREIYDRPAGPPHITNQFERVKFIRSGIARFYGLTADQLNGAQRNANIVRARHEAMWLISKCTGWSLVQIGKAFGGRDHSTVISAIRRHQERIDAGTVGP